MIFFFRTKQSNGILKTNVTIRKIKTNKKNSQKFSFPESCTKLENTNYKAAFNQTKLIFKAVQNWKSKNFTQNSNVQPNQLSLDVFINVTFLEVSCDYFHLNIVTLVCKTPNATGSTANGTDYEHIQPLGHMAISQDNFTR